MSKAAELAALIGSQTALSNRNLIINGAMQVWQRGTTIDTITNGAYLCDRWKVIHAGTDGNVDVDRSTDVPSGQGFGYSQKISMDASETSLDADDQVQLQQRIEGQNLQQLAKGTSSAKSVTLSFWVKSSVASTYTVLLKDHDNSRINGKTYVISAANTWEHKTLTFTGDTTGALDNDNDRSLDVHFYLDAGSTYTGGTFVTSWAADANNTRVSDTTGWLESTSPEWYITGVQLEVGEQATPFQHRSFADELARCQRYYTIINSNLTGDSNDYPVYPSARWSSTQMVITMPIPTSLRASAAVTRTGGNIQFQSNGTSTDVSTVTHVSTGRTQVSIIGNVGFTPASQTAGVGIFLTGARINLDAEL